VVIVKPVLNQYMKLMFWHLVQTGPRYFALLRKILTSLALLSEPQLASQGKNCQMWTSFWSHCIRFLHWLGPSFWPADCQLCLNDPQVFRLTTGPHRSFKVCPFLFAADFLLYIILSTVSDPSSGEAVYLRPIFWQLISANLQVLWTGQCWDLRVLAGEHPPRPPDLGKRLRMNHSLCPGLLLCHFRPTPLDHSSKNYSFQEFLLCFPKLMLMSLLFFSVTTGRGDEAWAHRTLPSSLTLTTRIMVNHWISHDLKERAIHLLGKMDLKSIAHVLDVSTHSKPVRWSSLVCFSIFAWWNASVDCH